MRDYILTIELSMDNIPDSDDFKKCVAGGFVEYCKMHPSSVIDLKYMHLSFDQQTLAHRDELGTSYLPQFLNIHDNPELVKEG